MWDNNRKEGAHMDENKARRREMIIRKEGRKAREQELGALSL